MNNNRTPQEHLYQWNFYLVDEKPGPSIGDAAEFLQTLGFDPWAFSKLDLVSESYEGEMAISKFSVAGSRRLVEELRAAHARATGSITAPIQLAPKFRDAEVPCCPMTGKGEKRRGNFLLPIPPCME